MALLGVGEAAAARADHALFPTGCATALRVKSYCRFSVPVIHYIPHRSTTIDSNLFGSSFPEGQRDLTAGALPESVNQDVAIEIALPHSRTLTKLRRLMRAPPRPSGSFVQPVQVCESAQAVEPSRF